MPPSAATNAARAIFGACDMPILENKLQTVIVATGSNYRLQFGPSPSKCRGTGREGSISPDMVMKPEPPNRIDVRVVARKALAFNEIWKKSGGSSRSRPQKNFKAPHFLPQRDAT
jgi:hypothetical protein